MGRGLSEASDLLLSEARLPGTSQSMPCSRLNRVGIATLFATLDCCSGAYGNVSTRTARMENCVPFRTA